MKNILKYTLTCLFVFSCGRMFAQDVVEEVVIVNDSVQAVNVVEVVETKETPSDSPKLSFAWGGDLGASIDLTGNDMSAFDFNVLVGIKRGWLNFLGVGLGADISISGNTKAYPIFVNFRTNFRNRPSLFFWDLRGGMAYNQLEHNHVQWGVYGSTGVGVNLARSSKFSSNLSLNYVFRQRKRVVGAEMVHEFTDLHMVSVRLGVIF